MEKRDRRCHCPWEAYEQRKSQVRPPRIYPGDLRLLAISSNGSTVLASQRSSPISTLPSHISPLFPLPAVRALPAPQPQTHAPARPLQSDRKRGHPTCGSSRRSLRDPLKNLDLRSGLSLSKSSAFSSCPILLLTTASCCFHYILQHTVPGPRLVSIERSN